MDSLSPELRQLITKVAKDHGIKKYSEEISKTVAKEGDGYVGIIEALNITDEESDSQLSLVIKRAPTNEALRKQFPTRAGFVREIRFYHEVAPAFKSFQQKYKVPNAFNNIARLYGFVEEELKEVLLLENLKSLGYNTCNRREPMDCQHLTLGLTTYGKLHAISHAMKRLEPETFEKITENIKAHFMLDFAAKNILEKMSPDSNFPDKNPMLDAFCLQAFQAIEGNDKLTEAVQRAKTNLIVNFMNDPLHRAGDDEFDVVVHADCWSTNLMFKYQHPSNPKIPTDVKLIDWQTSFVTNPVFDLSYFILINAAKPDLENYLHYLKVYYESLSSNLRAFGLDVGSFYPFEMLEAHWRRYAFIGFQMCLVMMNQSLSETKTHDFEQLAREGRNLFDTSIRQPIISDLFKQRMTDLIEFLDNNQLI